MKTIRNATSAPRRAMPTSTTVAFVAMIVTAGLVAINFVQDAILAASRPTAGVLIAFLFIALALSVQGHCSARGD